MKLRILIVLACTLLAVSACIIEPIGDGGDRRGGHDDHYRGDHDYGRRVWR